MKTALKTCSVVAAMSLVAACGGNSGPKDNPALSKSFNYGSPAAPASGESAAASTVKAQLSGVSSLSSSPDATKGQNLASLPDSVASQALGSSGAFLAPLPEGVIRPLQSLTSTDPCITTTATSIKYNNCTVSTGYTLNGSFNATQITGGSNLNWDVVLAGSNSSNGSTVTLNFHMLGNIDAGASTIKGTASSDINVKASMAGQPDVQFGFSTGLKLDLGYASNPFCINSGTMAVSRVWTNKPAQLTDPRYNDLSELFTWTGCDQVQVAHST